MFAVGTVVQVAIGQEPYLLGETLGAAVAAGRGAARRLWPLALPLAVASSLASPLAGGFLAMAAIAWMLGSLAARGATAPGRVAAAGARAGRSCSRCSSRA